MPTSTPPAPGAARPPTPRPPGQHRLPLTTSFLCSRPTASLPVTLGRPSAWLLQVSLGLQPHSSSVQPPSSALHLHLHLPLPRPHFLPLPCTTPKPGAASPEWPALNPQSCQPLLDREMMCYDFWKLQGLPQCWFNPREQGLGGGSCCGPVSVQPPLRRRWGMLAPQTAPNLALHITDQCWPQGCCFRSFNQDTTAYCPPHTPTWPQLCQKGRASRPGCCRGGAAARAAEPFPLSCLCSQRSALGLWHPWIFPSASLMLGSGCVSAPRVGNVGCWVGVAPGAQLGMSLRRVCLSAFTHLTLCVGKAQQPLHRLRGLGVAAEGVQTGLCWLCFHTTFPWRDALPQKTAKPFLCKLS